MSSTKKLLVLWVGSLAYWLIMPFAFLGAHSQELFEAIRIGAVNPFLVLITLLGPPMFVGLVSVISFRVRHPSFGAIGIIGAIFGTLLFLVLMSPFNNPQMLALWWLQEPLRWQVSPVLGACTAVLSAIAVRWLDVTD